MGLDMYLSRMHRYRNADADMVCAIESFLDLEREKAEGGKYANDTFKEWCGRDEIPPQKYIDFYSQFYKKHYSDWDTEQKYGYYTIRENVGYWRKANQIHNWFVENIQDGVDDCNYHREVTENDLLELLYVCQTVLNNCELVHGQVCNGYTYEDGERIPIMEPGRYVKDTSVAKELLPTASGFFFGSYDYDEWYVEDIKNTIDIITKVLETTDFETQMIYYCSSW